MDVVVSGSQVVRMLKIDQNYRIKAPKFPCSARDHPRINGGKRGARARLFICNYCSYNEIT